MKKCVFVVLMGFPSFLFSQQRDQVFQQAIDKVNIELVKEYTSSKGQSFSQEIDSGIELYQYLQKKYPNEQHPIHETFINLNYAKGFYTGNNLEKDLSALLEKYVKYDYDKNRMDSILTVLPKEIATASTDSLTQQGQDTTNIDHLYFLKVKQDKINTLQAENATLKRTNEALSNEVAQLKIAEDSLKKLLAGLLIGVALFSSILLIRSRGRKKLEQEKENKKDKTMPLNSKEKKDWLIVHTSEPGKSHLKAKPPIPCQDSHAVLPLNEGWGIAVSCDGAGSAKLSHEGSKFVAEAAIQLFKEIITKNKWVIKNTLPKEADWEKLSLKALKKLRYDLIQYGEEKKYDSSDLACTVIVVIYSPIGLLCTHIGDGRAGYQDKKGHWKAILSPHKGEEANQTIFITSNPWLSNEFKMSGVKVPESTVIKDPPKAFTLMSDGCEAHSFELGYFDKQKEKFIEKNNPYPKFFNPILQTILSMKKENLTQEEMLAKWSKFVKEGTPKLKNEPDDKTLIIGVLTD